MAIEGYNEKVDYENPLLSYKLFTSRRAQSSEVPWHYHKEFEMLAVIEGSLDVYIEDRSYRIGAGGVVLIGSNQLHRDRLPDVGHVVFEVLQFDMQPFLDPANMPYYHYFSDANASSINDLNDAIRCDAAVQQELHRSIRLLREETTNKQQGYEIAVNILIRQIILSLLRSRPSDSRHLLRTPDWHRFKPVLDYVERQLTGEINVTEACRLANISYYYFVKSFKATFGHTFVEYVQQQKVKLAERILLTKDVNITEVAEAVGLPNMAHFYKCFKRFTGCSPTHYRKKMDEWSRI